jgi:C-terminal processing protease CtpA/Prc
MKKRKNIKLFVLLLIVTGALAACHKSEPTEEVVEEKDPANVWIDETMRNWYLWEDEIPKADNLDYTADAELFFAKLLSMNDGKTSGNTHYYYSTINKKKNVSRAYQGDANSFGFEFQYYNLTFEGSTLYYFLEVLYVLPESPAAEQGLKRGDWILKINGEPVPGKTTDLLKVLDTSTPKEVTFGLNDVLPKLPETKRELKITPRMVVDNPVFVDTTYRINSKHISYLVFNHFTAGASDTDETFHNSLRRAFASFKSNGTDEFILDLRYNQGGLVRTAQLLTTMLAPASALGDVFCRFSYNKNYKSDSILLDRRLINGSVNGANLDLKRIFIITSARTASASEAVINGLEPYMSGNVILVGNQTEGKNVASSPFSDDKYEWELHPIISKISNKAHFSDYSGGFAPTFPCVETNQDHLYELGDINEFMLKQVLNYILYGQPVTSRSTDLRSSDGNKLIPLYNSLDRRGSKLIMEPRNIE